jgi:flagellar basal body-associated protein FliL
MCHVTDWMKQRWTWIVILLTITVLISGIAVALAYVAADEFCLYMHGLHKSPTTELLDELKPYDTNSGTLGNIVVKVKNNAILKQLKIRSQNHSDRMVIEEYLVNLQDDCLIWLGENGPVGNKKSWRLQALLEGHSTIIQ